MKNKIQRIKCRTLQRKKRVGFFLAIAGLERLPFVFQYMHFYMYFFFGSHSNRFCFFFLISSNCVSGRLSGTFSTFDVYTISFFFSRVWRGFINSIISSNCTGSSNSRNEIRFVACWTYNTRIVWMFYYYHPVSRRCASQCEPNRIKPNQNS